MWFEKKNYLNPTNGSKLMQFFRNFVRPFSSTVISTGFVALRYLILEKNFIYGWKPLSKAISMPKKADITITIINYHVYSFGVQYAEAEVGWNAYLVTFICHVFIYAFGGPFFFWERKIVSTCPYIWLKSSLKGLSNGGKIKVNESTETA